ncbi:TetR family transcriptional regulator [Cryptosporangium japonicum]|uniref:TetR family transcriptional regulator n=1 Tax=Cryptosporangium japonicum TaxID=80872 RepID=UPI0031CEB7C2
MRELLQECGQHLLRHLQVTVEYLGDPGVEVRFLLRRRRPWPASRFRECAPRPGSPSPRRPASGARQCLIDLGWARTTVRDIAEAAGANHAAVGYRFGSEDAQSRTQPAPCRLPT